MVTQSFQPNKYPCKVDAEITPCFEKYLLGQLGCVVRQPWSNTTPSVRYCDIPRDLPCIASVRRKFDQHMSEATFHNVTGCLPSCNRYVYLC